MYGIMISELKTSTMPPCDSILIATISRTPPEVQPPRPGNLVRITVANTKTETCQARPMARAVMKSPRYCVRARKLIAVLRSAVRHSPRNLRTRLAAAARMRPCAAEGCGPGFLLLSILSAEDRDA